MNPIFLYVIGITFIASVIRSTFGFGESLVGVPLLLLCMPIETAVPLSVLISVVIALLVVVQDHAKIHLSSAKWLIVFAMLGIPIGLIILVYGDPLLVKTVLGFLIILYALYSLVGKGSFRLSADHKGWLFACGFLSGVFGGAYGLNGPPLVIYGNMRRWSATHFRATLQAYFLPASLLGIIGYFVKGLVTREVMIYFLVSLPAVIPAVFLGRYLNHKLRDDTFFKYVYVGLIVIGLVLIFDAWLKK